MTPDLPVSPATTMTSAPASRAASAKRTRWERKNQSALTTKSRRTLLFVVSRTGKVSWIDLTAYFNQGRATEY